MSETPVSRHPGRALRRWLHLALFAALGAYALHRYPVPSQVSSYADGPDYQSLAVNLLKGQGYRAGLILPFEEYAFDPAGARDVKASLAGEHGPFYRSPGYPLALAMIYRLFGIRPNIAMLLQLLALVTVCALLSILGNGLLGWRGFVGGMIGGVVFIRFYAGAATQIMTETLICLSVFLVLAAWLLFQRRNDWVAGSVMGAALALALLVKGSMIFLPLFFLGYALLRALGPKSYSISGLLAAIVVFIVPVALWSAYASERSGRPIFLCTQGPDVLLDGNNEYSLAHGDWSPQWREDPNSFYSRAILDHPGRSPYWLVAQFYAEHPSYLPALLIRKKLGNAAWETPPRLFISLQLLVTACLIIRGGSRMRLGLLIALAAALILLHFKFAPVFLVWLALLAAGLFSGSLRPQLPKIWRDAGLMGCTFVLVNFLLITVAFYGQPRIVWPAYFLLLTAGGYLAIRLLEECETWFGSSWFSTHLKNLVAHICPPNVP